MKPYKKYNYSTLVLGILLSITSSYAQIITKTKQLKLDVKQHVNILHDPVPELTCPRHLNIIDYNVPFHLDLTFHS